MGRFCLTISVSVFVVISLYLLLWKQRFGDWIVRLLRHILKIKYEEAFYIYHSYFRGYKEIFFAVAIIFVFVFLLWRLFRWMTRYFKEIDQGIDALLGEDGGQIYLSPEMLPFERKLNAVKKELENQKAERVNAERRKDELVMYLAHDIRTPLTSVIGYLNLLEEDPDMPLAQRAKNVHITLEKANRLEEMINEFFEITRLNTGQIRLYGERIDLYYMLVQLCDEISPVLDSHGNSVVLKMEEDLVICADSDKMARVFSNIMRNAAAYSYPKTEIMISAEKTDTDIILFFKNKGKTIPPEKLSLLFDKFYRLDSSRVSDTGGTGLGLAISKEIISLHGGDIWAMSENETVTFGVRLPLPN
ncbi:MAG: HAMP domain-containing histidine kinase [Lachnospiraceae bacterium]|nr:HAMP domain-containing histidine kinase [Lachnospiraceae bacterium]